MSVVVQVERGKVRLLLDEGHEDEQRDAILGAIGSAKPGSVGSREVTFAFSPTNLQKTKALFQDSTLADDPTSRDAIADLRARRVTYFRESELGAKVKSGLRLVEEYAFKKPPFAHQVVGFSFLHAMATPALFGDCGTGKTFIAATFADSLIQRGEKWKFIVVCPPNLIRRVWVADVANFTDLLAVSLRPDAVKRAERELERKAAFLAEADIYVINPENIRIARKDRRKADKLSLLFDLLRRKRREGFRWGLFVDESSKMKSRTSATYRAIRDIREYCERCVIMTGTPSPNGAPDLWPQFDVLDLGQTLQPSFVDYRFDTHNLVTFRGVEWKDKQGTSHAATSWKPKRGIASTLYKQIEPRAIRFRAEDCIDLPPKTVIVREVEMGIEQAAIYSDMEKLLFAEFDGSPVTAKVAAAKMMKLREITGGFVITDDGKQCGIGSDSPKMVELDALLEQSIADKLGDTGPPTKALIWAEYRWECNALVERYKKAYGARGLFGGISYSAKDEAIDLFQRDPSARLLVCHSASVGHGLTLTEASYCFYYSLSHDYERFYQSARRIARPGQHMPMFFYLLACRRTIDEDILAALADKKDFQDTITDGQVNRDGFLERRRRTRDRIEKRIDLTWEVPVDQQRKEDPAR